jgi:hypothetical protein
MKKQKQEEEHEQQPAAVGSLPVAAENGTLLRLAKMFIENFWVESPNVKYGAGEIESDYRYDTTELVHESHNGASKWVVRPKSVNYQFKTNTNVPKLG